jgi:DNA-binding response OmpR family regulator
MRVLVVEDDELTWLAMEPHLTFENHLTYWAARATDAFVCLATNPIDLVLLDIDLGEGQLSGLDVVRAMIEHDAWRDIRRIIISGMTAEAIHERARTPVRSLLDYVDVILDKPLDLEKLKTAMRHVMEAST